MIIRYRYCIVCDTKRDEQRYYNNTHYDDCVDYPNAKLF